MLRALPLKKAAKFLETPVEDFENESPLDARDTLGWKMCIRDRFLTDAVRANPLLITSGLFPASKSSGGPEVGKCLSFYSACPPLLIKNVLRLIFPPAANENRKSWKPATCGMKEDGAREGTRTPTVYHH